MIRPGGRKIKATLAFPRVSLTWGVAGLSKRAFPAAVAGPRGSSMGPKFLRPLTAPDAEKGRAVHFGPEQALALDCGRTLAPWTVAYMTYGKLNEARSNAVLVCHALTGDQHVANEHPVTGKPGWWTTMVGPGRQIDTDPHIRHLVAGRITFLYGQSINKRFKC